MKKFYTTMAAITASLAVSVSAATIARLPQNGPMELTKHTEAVAIAPNSLPAINKGEATMTIKPIHKSMNKKVGAQTMEDLYGEYQWAYYDLQNFDEEGNPEIYSYEVSFVSTDALQSEQTFEPNEFVITGFAGYNLLASFDARTGSISLQPTICGYSEKFQEYLIFSNCKLDPTATEPTTKNIMPDFDNPLVFTLETLEEGEQSWFTNGYYGVSGFIMDEGADDGVSTWEDGYYMLCQVGLVSDSPWFALGEAEWTDGIFQPWFSDKTDQKTAKVKIYQNTGYDDVRYYRIMSPYQASLGIASGKMDFIIDDPTLVEVPLQASTINVNNRGITYFGSAAYLFAVTDDEDVNMSYEEYIEAFKAKYPDRCITATEADGIMTVNFPKNSICMCWPTADQTTSGINPNGLYSLKDEAAMVSTLKFSTKQDGIEDIIATPGVNAPVEYFNLQGIRVNEPAKGQLVIKRQGNKTSKVVM